MGAQLYLIHPGKGEALQSTMFAIAEGVGKEATIRMMRSTTPLTTNSGLRMEVDKVGDLDELGGMVFECLVSDSPPLFHYIDTNSQWTGPY
jgi:hypothetical protein